MKLWQKGITPNARIERFTVGNDYVLDKELLRYDCLASMAHARMLHKIGILNRHEQDLLVDGLKEIIDLDQQGKFEIAPSDEDCHTAIENYLTQKLGDVGKKIHTGRSRNDQVLTAMRLLYRDAIDRIDTLAEELSGAFRHLNERFGSVAIPGFTHTRKAMPSSVGMWAGAFTDALDDDRALLRTVRALINQSPLGTAAGYGVSLKLDREFTARELGFDTVQQNPVYAQLSRGKFEASILHVFSQILFNLNRCASDLILWSMPGWGFFELPADYCTGSSIMPQKMNPDVLELIRGHYHLLNGLESQVKNLMGNLITGYHRDAQLGKEPVLKGIEITAECLSIMTTLIEGIKVDAEKAARQMSDELFATEKAYKLVEQGVPFREAYRRIAKSLFEK